MSAANHQSSYCHISCPSPAVSCQCQLDGLGGGHSILSWFVSVRCPERIAVAFGRPNLFTVHTSPAAMPRSDGRPPQTLSSLGETLSRPVSSARRPRSTVDAPIITARPCTADVTATICTRNVQQITGGEPESTRAAAAESRAVHSGGRLMLWGQARSGVPVRVVRGSGTCGEGFRYVW